MKKRNIIPFLLLTFLLTLIIEIFIFSIVVRDIRNEKLSDGTELTVFSVEW